MTSQLIKSAEQAHRQALRSLGAFYRSGVGTATARKHWETYERATSKFEAAVAALRVATEV